MKKTILFFMICASTIYNWQFESHAESSQLFPYVIDEHQNVVLEDVEATFLKAQIKPSPYPCASIDMIEIEVNCDILIFSDVSLYSPKAAGVVFSIQELVFPFDSHNYHVKDMIDTLLHVVFKKLYFEKLILSKRIHVSQISKNYITLASAADLVRSNFKGNYRLEIGFGNSKFIKDFLNSKEDEKKMIIYTITFS